ncbi:hypothetical protein [Bradyrhizobium guangxiense]|uniref:hypothetical protein n=1 Tax=Bradyrhizobium guangxiense TaxID=1325115 RepID=UPI001008DA19|nr:hypothetical protein [Bradyrhizobium guangxiense]
MSRFDKERYLGLTEDRISRGEQRISRQLALIEKLRHRHHSTDLAEDTLSAMETTLRQFYKQRNTLLSLKE